MTIACGDTLSVLPFTMCRRTFPDTPSDAIDSSSSSRLARTALLSGLRQPWEVIERTATRHDHDHDLSCLRHPDCRQPGPPASRPVRLLFRKSTNRDCSVSLQNVRFDVNNVVRVVCRIRHLNAHGQNPAFANGEWTRLGWFASIFIEETDFGPFSEVTHKPIAVRPDRCDWQVAEVIRSLIRRESDRDDQLVVGR